MNRQTVCKEQKCWIQVQEAEIARGVDIGDNGHVEIVTRIEGWKHSRELLVNGNAVSWLRVQDYLMRIGSAQVRMGGIAAVGTAEEERMKGYSRALMEDSIEYMTAEGYDVSALFGIRNYYHRFGYAVCLPVNKLIITTRNAEAVGSGGGRFRIRDYTDSDLDALLALYEHANSARTRALARPKEYYEGIHKGSHWGIHASTIVLETAGGQFAGYAAFDQSNEFVNITEVEAWDAAAYPTLLREFARMAIDRRCSEITIFAPPDHPFAEYCHRFECKVIVEYPKSGGGMMRIINQNNLFQRIEKELSGRLAGSGLHNYSGRVAIRTELDQTVLDISQGRVSVQAGEAAEDGLELPQSKLMQLVTGYRSVRDVLTESDVKMSADILLLLQSLFPKGNPYVWVGDYF